MDIINQVLCKEEMQRLAAAKHMKTKAVTGKQSAAKGKGGNKNAADPTVKKQSIKSNGTRAPKKAPKEKTVKTQPTKPAKDDETFKYSLAKIKKSKKNGDKKKDDKKSIKKKPKERLPSFGSKDTVVLMMRGAHGDNQQKRVFKNDMKIMRDLFEDERYFGIRKENIISIPPPELSAETTVRGCFMKNVTTIKDKLKKAKKSRFIFYYTGHFSDDASFWIENAGTPDDDLRDEDLKKFILRTSAEYIVFILDCCFSGKAEIGAKRVKKTFANPPVPQLWDIGQGGSSGQKGGSSKYSGIRKAVQLCSSHAGQTSGYGDKYSFFTAAIHNSVTRPGKDLKKLVPPGKSASVLQIFKETKNELQLKQKAVIKPDSAAREKYFENFPTFAKIKNTQKNPTPSTSSSRAVDALPQSTGSYASLGYPGSSAPSLGYPGSSAPGLGYPGSSDLGLGYPGSSANVQTYYF